MKNLKHLAYLFLALLFIASCEKETEISPENSEIDNQKIESTDLQNYKSIAESIESGFDLESYQKSMSNMKKMESTQTSYILDDFVPTNLHFFYSPEAFECVSLPTEDFEEGVNGTTSPDFIDENTNSNMFSPGDILPDVSIHTMNNSGTSSDNFYLYDVGFSKALFVNYYVDYLIIDFTTNNVTAVNMDVFSIWGESDITIEVFGNSGSLGTTVVYGTNSGTYWGVKSEEPITRITLYSLSNQAEGIDNLTFGACDDDDLDGDGVLKEDDLCPSTPFGETVNGNGCAQSQLDDDNDGVMNTVDNCSNTPSGETVNENGCGQSQLDYDNDGVMNNKDAHIYSDMSTFINIGGFYPNVKNKLVRNGSTMMDQIGDLINEINVEYNGSNYTDLHRKFIMLLERKATDWRRNRLITNRERDAISRSAASASIPYYNNNEY